MSHDPSFSAPPPGNPPPPQWQYPPGSAGPYAQQPPPYPNQSQPPQGYHPQGYPGQGHPPQGYHQQGYGYPTQGQYGQFHPGQPYSQRPANSAGRSVAGALLLLFGALLGLGSLLQLPDLVSELKDDPARAFGRMIGIFLFSGLPMIIGMVLLLRRRR